MTNIEEFYFPRPIVKKFVQMKIEPKKAIELGCGGGRDTIFLIKSGWQVLSIDKENTKEIITDKLTKDELRRFRFSKQNFEEITLEKNNLIVANFSIPFCKKDNFNKFWSKICNSILKDGYFVGNFFGLNDSWAKKKKNILFLSKEQVLELFKNSFEIIRFDEIENDRKAASGEMKHWHIYNIIAKKK